MYLTDGYNIEIPRGDSASVRVVFKKNDEDKSPYIFYDGQYALLSVFPVIGADAVTEKTVPKSAQTESGAVIFDFTPEDTDLPRGEYIYTIRLLNADGTLVDTRLGFPQSAIFAVGTGCTFGSCGCTPGGDINVTIATEGGGDYPPYTGDYTATPQTDNAVILETKNKAMRDNVTVEKIPSYSVENTSGGNTFIIGG